MELSKVHFCRQSLHFAFCQLTSPPQPRHAMSFKENFAKVHLGTEISRQEGASESFEAVGIVLLIDSNLQFLSLQTVGATTINVAQRLSVFLFSRLRSMNIGRPLGNHLSSHELQAHLHHVLTFNGHLTILSELSTCDPLHCNELVKSE